MQEFHGLRASGFQEVALALARRTLVFNIYKSFTDSHHQRTSDGVLEGLRTRRDRQDATVRLIRVVLISRTMFWNASGSSNGCLPTRQFPR
eukprot:4807261-Pyramimonas_sp.AAC.1